MVKLFHDPLLSLAAGLLSLIIFLSAAAGALMLIGVPVVLFNQGQIIAELATEAPGMANAGGIGAIIALLVGGAAFAAIAWLFARLLRRIVASVAQGDPFAPVNAVRLNRMAWLALAGQALAIPVGLVAMWLKQVAAPGDIDVQVSFAGILLAIVLFILARVFRHGAAMRDDLEGTV